MKKIAVLYICIGRYSVMWEGFYESSKRHFFKNNDVNYFVFTDSDTLKYKDSSDVKIIKERDYGWPGNTLYRFRMFDSIKEHLIKYDYAYFFNANAFFVKDVDEDIEPNEKQQLVLAQHFKMINKNPIRYGYDRNKKSKAYVKWGYEGKDYIQACFIGATAKEMVKLSEQLSQNISQDDNNNVVAKWHDESHLNKYIIDRDYKLLSVSYVYPEVLNLPIAINILMRDKNKFADLSVLRYGKKSLKRVILQKTVNQLIKIRITFYIILSKLGMIKKRGK